MGELADLEQALRDRLTELDVEEAVLRADHAAALARRDEVAQCLDHLATLQAGRKHTMTISYGSLRIENEPAGEP